MNELSLRAMFSAQRKWKYLLAICIIIAALVYAYPFEIHIVRDDTAGEMLWNSQEAYLFMTVARRGYRISYLRFPWAVLMQWFGAVPPPTDQRVLLWVIHVTPSGTERHLGLTSQDTAGVPSSFTPMGGTIYTFCQGVLCKWSGSAFEKATADEEQKIGGIPRLSRDLDTTINGWNKRGIGTVAGAFQFNAKLGEQVTLTVKQGNIYVSPVDPPRVEFHRSGEPVKVIWNLNTNPRIVTRGEYKKTFEK